MRQVKLTIGDKVTKFSMPTNWDEVSLTQYKDLMLAIDKEDSEEIELMIKSLEALTCIDRGILSKVPLKQIRTAYSMLGHLTTDMPSNELKRVIEIDGIEYGIIPDFDDLSLGEFVDLDNYLQDSWNNLTSIMTVLYRPVNLRDGDKYTIEPYTMSSVKDRRRIFNDSMSVNSVYGALVFFCNIGRSYTEITLLSLEEEIKSQSTIKSSQMIGKEIV
tara:strand:- start:2491 stop:3141 length:651 start_codon:yes stop_codon:yes gene_type:complete